MIVRVRGRGLVGRACCAALVAVLASACSSGDHGFPWVELGPPGPGADAAGGPGTDVTAYDFSNQQYFEVQPGGEVSVRAAYEKTIAITCDVGWGRTCALGVGIPMGSVCFCKSVWGPIWGHAV
jgi:hypothetical protein